MALKRSLHDIDDELRAFRACCGSRRTGGAQWEGIMVWTRRKKRPKRPGYVRRSRAAPKTGWSLRELAALAGVSARTVRLYLHSEVLPRPPFKGSATRYQRRELLRLCAIRHLRSTEKLELKAIRARLNALTAPELEALVVRSLPAGKLAAALGVQPAPPAAANAAAPAGAPSSSGWIAPAPRWRRIELALGLELHLRDDASARVLELAERMAALARSAGSASG
jgi:DNA-binding transcriptional MerR regulator